MISLGEYVGRREKLTCKQFWSTAGEEVAHSAQQLDKEVVNPNQIRLMIRAVKDNLPQRCRLVQPANCPIF